MQPDKNVLGLCHIVRSNAWLMSVLETVRDCELPEWVVGAAVIRNAVWDRLHEYPMPTPLRDLDSFDAADLRPEREQYFQRALFDRRPDVPWDVKNQAAVHLWYESKFGLPATPLTSIEDAVATWPETATCVGVRLLPDGELLVLAPLGLDDLFRMVLRRNPRRSTPELFQQRLREKRLCEKWPRVRVIDG